MASVSSHFNRAVALHREAAAHTAAARAELAKVETGRPGSVVGQAAYERVAERLNRAAEAITPGWLGCDIDLSARSRKVGVNAQPGEPMHVRIGTTIPFLGTTFRVPVPFLGAGHLAID